MPAIAKIRFTNVVYENGGKRYNDEIFDFDGHNSALLLENGGGKTVFIQTALQAIIPHIDMAERKIKDTLSLENAPAHIAIEWILNDQPRRYALTATSLYIENNQLNSLKYVCDYSAGEGLDIESLPFAKEMENGAKRPATRGEISDYYSRMSKQVLSAKTFTTINAYGKYIENTYKIIPSEWRKVATINSGEGNVDEFFNKCKTTQQLLNNLLIPVVEEAIEGDNTAKFVETFERQRNHFKKNSILVDKIEQSEGVKNKIDDYVKVFSSYEEERLALTDVKREAKTVTNYVMNQLENKKIELEYNIASSAEVEKEWHNFKHREMSYEWLIKKETLDQLILEKDQLEQHLNDRQNSYDQFAKRKQNIEISRLIQETQKCKDQLVNIKKNVENLDEDVDIQDVKSLLYENACWINGSYAYELELIEREIALIDCEVEKADKAYQDSYKEHEEGAEREKALIGEKSLVLAKVEMLESQIEDLREGLFEADDMQSSQVLLHRIQEQQSDLEKDCLRCEKEVLESESERHKVEQSIDSDHHSIKDIKEQLFMKNVRLDHYKEAQVAVLQSLEEAGLHGLSTSNLYSKEASLLCELEEIYESLSNRKEGVLLEERKHFGIAQLYSSMKQFSTEPILEQVVNELVGTTSYIATGMSHLSEIKKDFDLDEDQLFSIYPYWAMTIVCSDSDSGQVKKTLQGFASSLLSMVIVISVESLKDIIVQKKRTQIEETVFPSSWRLNMSIEGFRTWQNALIVEGEEFQCRRKEMEVALKLHEVLMSKVKDFFTSNPYDTFKELVREIDEQKAILSQLMKEVEEKEWEKKELVRHLEYCNTQLVDIDKQRKEIELLKVNVKELEEKEVQMALAESALLEAEKAYEKGRKRQEKLSENVEEIRAHRQRLIDGKMAYQRERDRILDLEIYNEVVDSEPIGTTTSLEVLRQDRDRLKKQLLGINSDREALESQEAEILRRISGYEYDIAQKKREAIYEIEVLEIYYQDEGEKLFDTMVEIKSEVDNLRAKLATKEKSVTELTTRCNVIREGCEAKYRRLHEFDKDTVTVAQEIRRQKATLQEREKRLNMECSSIEDYIDELQQIKQKLLIKESSFGFLVDAVEPLRMSDDYFEEFDMNPEAFVNQLSAGLDGQHQLAQDAYESVMCSQEDLVDYCKEEVSDLRLRETVIKGIGNKDSYSDLLSYQEKMMEIITKIIQVAEDDKRESDLELQTFLSHLLAYIKNVIDELDMIQNKTRIALDDVVKQIFIFDIPRWQDDEAKKALRAYIDETINFYERESYLGNMDESGIKKEIEERLSVKNLLEVVTAQRPIRIKCRKVTNDMKINKAPMSWENSNRWSGGEKWSKNMTLFLSILNYLAEKKQHLSANQKRQRSVILDNPFGKASSNHVLKPVFVIAEKLGFQIIALTAHAEGKFISEYFPVVYSCRLRQTKDREKQLMTNERTLNYAYLKEHSPMTIMRMTQVEQLTLF